MKGKQRISRQDLDQERQSLLEQLQDLLETPMIVLAFVWLALFVIEIVWGLSPFLEIAGYVIWSLFILEFALGFTVAPGKVRYLKHNVLRAVALLAPALRVLRFWRFVRLARLSRAAGVTRSLRLVRVVSSLNRGMRALAASMSRRGFGYVMLLTLLVVLVGAAGIYAMERGVSGGGGLPSYSDALWWTSMIMTTLGSEYWPQTASGRVLCLVLSMYAFAIFGYVTATLATFFIGSDADNEEAELASARSIAELRLEIGMLRDEIRALRS